MVTRLAPKLALATIAAATLYLPTLFAPESDSCTWTAGIAGAAPTPSPSCGGDLRECLRLSADMHQTTFGGRYVTAEDVSRCMETFNACTHGTASGGGGNPVSTSAGTGSGKGLPQHFGIKATGNGEVAYDCRLNGDSVNCTLTLLTKFDGTDSWSASFAGTRSGLTVTGSVTGNVTGHAPRDPSCGYEQHFSGPARYVFNPDGTVMLSEGPFQNHSTGTGSCPSSSSYASEMSDSAGTWSPK